MKHRRFKKMIKLTTQESSRIIETLPSLRFTINRKEVLRLNSNNSDFRVHLKPLKSHLFAKTIQYFLKTKRLTGVRPQTSLKFRKQS